MTRPGFRTALAAFGLMLAAAPAHAQAGRPVTFTKDVLPILQARCSSCHGAAARGGLRLDSLANVKRGGAKRGPAVRAGNPNASPLLLTVTGRMSPKMPQGGPDLSAREIAILTDWIAQGAKDDGQTGSAVGSAGTFSVGRPVTFTKDILPIFQTRCALCHGAQQSGGLKLDSLESVMKGGAKGPVIKPGDVNASRLVGMVEGRLSPRMPKGGQSLSDTEKMLIRVWIQQGAKDDADAQPVAASRPLELLTPKPNSTVREKVAITIPRESIPPDGFVSIYVDKQFKVALAPPAVDEGDEKPEENGGPGKKPVDLNVKYVWDTKQPLTDSITATAEDRFAQDGAHLIEVTTHKSDGSLAERVLVPVTLQNKIAGALNRPANLRYGGSVGRQYELEHIVNLEASGIAEGVRPGQVTAPTNDKFTHIETGKSLVSLEDLNPASGNGFWRERRLSPLSISLNGVKQIIRLDSSSRYYSMDRAGRAQLTKVMEREKREPLINPIELPGGFHRLNEPFTTTVHINLGAYIPATLSVERLQATCEGMEYQFGEPCIRIRVNYLAGKGKLQINSVNIPESDFEIQQGQTTVWFSEKTQRVVRAKHELNGTLVVDAAQVGNPGGGLAGEPGGEFGPSDAPGGFAPGGFAPGGALGSSSYGPGGAAPGGFGSSPYAGAGAYGSGSPYGGGGVSDLPGSGGYGGAFPGASGPDNTAGGVLPTKKRYHVKLKVETQLAQPGEKK